MTQAVPIAEKKESVVAKIVKMVVAVAVGALFLWLAFRDCDLNQIWTYSKEVSPVYMLLLCVSVVISHILRAWRWQILLRPLSKRKPSIFNCFSAVVIGYAVNIVIPRGGEVVRLVSISKSENLPWAGVLPTMFIDRLLDLALLCLVFGTTIPFLPPSLLQKMPYLTTGGAMMIVGSLVMLILLPKMSDYINFFLALPSVKKLLPEKIIGIAEGLSEQFKIGTKSLTDATAYPGIAALSLAIWFFYWLNCYMGVLGFHLEKQVSLLQTYITYAVGSIGVLVPSPGSVGGYHFFTSQGLILTAGVDKDLALAYATVLHMVAFVIVNCVAAFICFVIQSNSSNKVKGDNQANSSEQEPTP